MPSEVSLACSTCVSLARRLQGVHFHTHCGTIAYAFPLPVLVLAVLRRRGPCQIWQVTSPCSSSVRPLRQLQPLYRQRDDHVCPNQGGFVMIVRSSPLLSLLLAGMFGALLVAQPAFAQQRADQPSAQPPAHPAASPPPAPAAAQTM